MTDIALVWNAQLGRADIAMAGSDLQMDDGLETEVIIRLFCDRLAGPDDEIPGGDDDPRGWWGDLPLPTDPDGAALDLTGSKFWLRIRMLQLPETLRLLESDALETLEPMKKAGTVGGIVVAASFPRLGWVRLDIVLDQKGSSRALQYEWQATGATTMALAA